MVRCDRTGINNHRFGLSQLAHFLRASHTDSFINPNSILIDISSLKGGGKRGFTMKDRNCNGSLVLDKIDYNRVLFRKVGKNNETSGKVSLPVDLIGKEIVIVIPTKEAKK